MENCVALRKMMVNVDWKSATSFVNGDKSMETRLEKKLNYEELGNLTGEFCWDFGHFFFIETVSGNFLWSDPDYGGNNEIKAFIGDFTKVRKYLGVPMMRDKGTHRIKDYCPGFVWKGNKI